MGQLWRLRWISLRVWTAKRVLPLRDYCLGLLMPAWREGSANWLASRVARLRVRAAHHEHQLSAPRAQEWLLIEWPR